MKAVLLGICCACVIAFGASVVLNALAVPASVSYATEGVRLSEH